MRLPRFPQTNICHDGISQFFFQKLVSFDVVANPYYRANMTALHTIFDHYTTDADVWQVREFASWLAMFRIVVHV